MKDLGKRIGNGRVSNPSERLLRMMRSSDLTPRETFLEFSRAVADGNSWGARRDFENVTIVTTKDLLKAIYIYNYQLWDELDEALNFAADVESLVRSGVVDRALDHSIKNTGAHAYIKYVDEVLLDGDILTVDFDAIEVTNKTEAGILLKNLASALFDLTKDARLVSYREPEVVNAVVAKYFAKRLRGEYSDVDYFGGGRIEALHRVILEQGDYKSIDVSKLRGFNPSDILRLWSLHAYYSMNKSVASMEQEIQDLINQGPTVAEVREAIQNFINKLEIPAPAEATAVQESNIFGKLTDREHQAVSVITSLDKVIDNTLEAFQNFDSAKGELWYRRRNKVTCFKCHKNLGYCRCHKFDFHEAEDAINRYTDLYDELEEVIKKLEYATDDTSVLAYECFLPVVEPRLMASVTNSIPTLTEELHKRINLAKSNFNVKVGKLHLGVVPTFVVG